MRLSVLTLADSIPRVDIHELPCSILLIMMGNILDVRMVKTQGFDVVERMVVSN